MAYIRVGQVWVDVELQSPSAEVWSAYALVEKDSPSATIWSAYVLVEVDDTIYDVGSDDVTSTSVTSYIEFANLTDNVISTSVTGYLEHVGDETAQSATSVSAYIEQAGDASRSITSVTAYIEFTGDTDIYATSLTAYAEQEGGATTVSATSLNAYLEIAPPVPSGDGSAYTSATSLGAYIERTDYPSDIVVSKVVALLATQDGGASVSQLGTYVEYTQTGLYITHFGVLVEVDEVETNIVPTYFREKTAGPQSLRRLPEEVVGYALDPSYSFWQIVVPEETINLIQNPSFELGTYNYNAAEIANWTRVPHSSVGSIAGRYVARRWYSGSEVSLYYGETEVNAAAGIYTFSCWVYAIEDFLINLRLYDDLNSINIAQRQFKVEYSGWHRYSITGSAPAFAELRCYLEFEADQQHMYVYTDAWQLERKGYATTYCDGDMVGFYEEKTDSAYYWTGEPHQSTSIRRGFTRSGGKIVSLSDDIGFLTTNIIGLGMSPIDLDVVEMADGSEIYRGAFFRSRRFTITGRIYGKNYMDLSERRELLVDAIKPDVTRDNQPLTILYAPTDKSGDEIVAPVEIQAAYQDGLTGNVSNWYTESIPLQFYATLPEIRSKIRESADITVNQEFGAVGVWAYYTEDVSAASGEQIERGWMEFDGGVTNDTVIDAAWNFDGKLLVCGDFTQIDGNAIYNVAEWDPGQADWYSKGVLAAATPAGPKFCAYGLGPSKGDIFVFSGFTTINGVAARQAAVYSGGSWSEVATGMAGAGASQGAIIPVPNGDVFFFGNFTQDGPAIRTFNRAVKYDQSADDWVALGGLANGLDDAVWDAKLGPDGNIYLCGEFTDDSLGSGTVSPYATRYNVQRDKFEPLGDGIPLTGPTGLVGMRVAVGKNGFVYVATDFPANQIWQWNGASWSLFYEILDQPQNSIADMEIDSDNNLHIVGSIIDDISANSVVHDLNYIILSGNVSKNAGFSIEDFETITSNVAYVNGIKIDPYGRIALFDADIASYPATVYQVREITTVTNSGSTSAYPIIKINGPGVIRSIRNYTADADIQFRSDFILQDNEILTLDLTGVRPKLYSNLRGRVQQALLSGASTLRRWRLLPGENEIEALMLDVGEDTEIWLEWQITHWSIDPSNL